MINAKLAKQITKVCGTKPSSFYEELILDEMYSGSCSACFSEDDKPLPKKFLKQLKRLGFKVVEEKERDDCENCEGCTKGGDKCSHCGNDGVSRLLPKNKRKCVNPYVVYHYTIKW